MVRKYFSATIPYDDAVTEYWINLFTHYVTDFSKFLYRRHQKAAANDIRDHLQIVFRDIIAVHRLLGPMMNLQCYAAPTFARFDIRYQEPTPVNLDFLQTNERRGYQIEGATLTIHHGGFFQAFHLEIKPYPPAPPLPRLAE